MRKTAIVAGLFFAGIIMLVSRPTIKAEEANTNIKQTAQPVMVEVQKGDSLTKIAKNHNTTYVRLFDANTYIQDPDIIHVGDKVRVPEESEQLQSRNAKVANFNDTKPTKQTNKVKSKQLNKQHKKTKTNKNIKKPSKNIQVTTSSAVQTDGGVWDSLARCESGGNWTINTGNGYYGGLQFTASTWKSVGGSGLPHQASREEQIMRGQVLQARSGWGQWPACTKKLGLR